MGNSHLRPSARQCRESTAPRRLDVRKPLSQRYAIGERVIGLRARNIEDYRVIRRGWEALDRRLEEYEHLLETRRAVIEGLLRDIAPPSRRSDAAAQQCCGHGSH